MLTALLLATTTAHAALPPTGESLRRINAITTTQAIYDKLGAAQWVRAIQDGGNGSYYVMTDTCRLVVQVTAIRIPHGPIGPAPLKVTPGELSCRR
jgi:hypothetical protein